MGNTNDLTILYYFNSSVNALLCSRPGDIKNCHQWVSGYMCSEEKKTDVDVSFPEEKKKNEEDGDFYRSYFWMEKPRVEFPFSEVL